MALTTYSGLKQAVADFLDIDAGDQVDDWIDLAEARHKREIRFRDMLVTAEIDVYDRTAELPTGFLEALSFRLLTNPLTVLRELNLHEMNRARREAETRPSFFTIRDEIEFDVIPDDSYIGEMVYYKTLTALSDSNTTNALLTEAPQLYLFAALAESAPYLANDERIAVWEAKYIAAREAFLDQYRKSRRVGPLYSRVSGPTP